mmetsp:Transcript_48441/g.75649  ORF Transcript_48441/g.75649 Transcript_48441/m.75649 type:complete len:128 (+) Transcript_48441:555-938(+)
MLTLSAQVMINFPEPPLWSGADGESRLHLLTPEFLMLVHKVLKPNGSITIFSDNLPYTKALAKTFSALKADGQQCFETHAPSKSRVLHQEIEGVAVFEGTPGQECGHKAPSTSYFDRLWSNGKHTKR